MRVGAGAWRLLILAQLYIASQCALFLPLVTGDASATCTERIAGHSPLKAVSPSRGSIFGQFFFFSVALRET